MNFDHLVIVSINFHLDERIHFKWLISKLFEQLLNFDIIQELVLRQAEYLECLWSGHETSFDPESFLSNLLAAGVFVFLRVNPIVLFL